MSDAPPLSLGQLDPEMVVHVLGAPDSFDADTDSDGTLHIEANGHEITVGDGETHDDEDKDFADNLAESMDETALAAIASELIREVQQDDTQRNEWLETREKGIAMLGLKIEEARGDIGATEAPLEGMSTYRSPALLQAVLRAQATARGELLPAAGPVKVTDDAAIQGADRDERAETLENDLNIYVTQVCPEYYPDTDAMLFWTAFGGVGFKKGYHDPLRRRPVIESIDAKDFIVSPGAADLQSAQRVTHRIRMKDSDVQRLMASGHFRQTVLTQPSPDLDSVADKKAEVMGLDNQVQLPKDQPRTLYEVNCERVLPDEYRPEDLPEDVPLPYRIVIDKDAQTVLSMRRRWSPDDPMAIGLLDYVRYPYVEGMGIYAMGLVHIIGNTTRALTAATREMIDAGMFANFSGFIYDEKLARQLTNEFRIPAGGGVKVQTGGGKLSDMIMPMPYKDVSSGLMNLMQHIEQSTEKLSGTAELPTGEGQSQMPVGTVLALIDQATKPLDAVHKRLHAAQSEEFQLLKRLLREDPGALWRSGKKLRGQWDEESFLKALDDFDLVPVSDPNVPTHTHRLLKAAVLKQLSTMNPILYDGKAVDTHILNMLGFGQPDQFFNQSPQQQPNPIIQAKQMELQAKMADTQAKVQDTQARLQMDKQKIGMDAVKAATQAQNDEADRQSTEQIEQDRMDMEREKLHAGIAADKHALGAGLVTEAAKGLGTPPPVVAAASSGAKPKREKKTT